MKKLNPSYLFYFAGILWIFAGIISENMSWGYPLGFAFIALGIAMRIKKLFQRIVKKKLLQTTTPYKKLL